MKSLILISSIHLQFSLVQFMPKIMFTQPSYKWNEKYPDKEKCQTKCISSQIHAIYSENLLGQLSNLHVCIYFMKKTDIHWSKEVDNRRSEMTTVPLVASISCYFRRRWMIIKRNTFVLVTNATKKSVEICHLFSVDRVEVLQITIRMYIPSFAATSSYWFVRNRILST